MGNSIPKPKKPPESPEEEEDESSFTCEICIEPTSASKKFKIKNTCRHPFCQDCIAKYIEVKVQDNTAKIECPEPNCQNHLDPLTCRPMISQSLFSSWCDLLCENCLLESERSYCPNRNCSALVLNECRGNVKKSKCPNCHQLFCFQCQTVWHAGYQCEENEEMRDRNDVLFGQLVERKKWTRCPACGQCVERFQGCSVVKCRCKAEFCYQCGKKVTSSGCGCKQSLGNLIMHVNFYPIIYIVVVFLFVVVWLSLHSMSLTPQTG